jgi:hypothetical protein
MAVKQKELLHRITGLGLTLYVLVHIVLLTGLTQGKQVFNEEMALFKTPVFLFFLLVAGCALVASFDVVYWRWMTRRDLLSQGFYALVLFSCFNVFSNTSRSLVKS